MLKNYIKTAFRNLIRNYTTTIINIIGLSTGLAIVILIALFAQNELSADNFHENLENIVKIRAGDVPVSLAENLKDEVPGIEKFVRISNLRGPMVLNVENNPINNNGIFFADSTFFEIFTFPVINGSIESALSSPWTIVLTEKLAKKLFGNEDPIGRSIHLNNTYTAQVTAVISNIPKNSSLNFEALISYISLKTIWGEQWYTNWGWGLWDCRSYLLKNQTSSVSEIEEKMVTKFKERYFKTQDLNIIPFEKMHFKSGGEDPELRSGNLSALIILITIGIFILIIALINYINLTTAQASKRAREVGLRKALGSGREQLIKQFLGESIIISLISMNFAIILANLFMPAFNNITESEFSIFYFNKVSHWIFFIVGGILIGFLSGIYPAFYLSAFKPVTTLKGEIIKSKGSSFFRKGLIVVQFVISISLIICTLFITKQLNFVTNTDPGFNKKNILYIKLSPEVINRIEVLKQKVDENPNIISYAFSSNLPGNTYYQEGVETIYKGEKKDQVYDGIMVDANFMDMMDFEIISGRNFIKGAKSDLGNVIINEVALKNYGWDDPYEAQILRGDSTSGYVIGVIRDFYSRSLHNKINPVVIFNNPDEAKFICLKLASDIRSVGNEVIKLATNLWEEISPSFPIEYGFLEENLDNLYSEERKYEKILIYFSILAILIACLGVFGMASFMTEKRTKEIGIRKVLGSKIPGIILLLSRQYTVWILISFIISGPIAYYFMNKWLQNFVYHTKLSWWIFLISLLIAMSIALLTVSYKVFKAANKNPADSLRYE